MSKLFEYHVHSEYSNPTTVMDCVTSVEKYIDRAKKLGMTAMCFTEHGNVYQWTKKKRMINEAGMKYVHGVEMYVTESLTEHKYYNIDVDEIHTDVDVSDLILEVGGIKSINWEELKERTDTIYINNEDTDYDFFTGYLRRRNLDYCLKDILITYDRVEPRRVRDNYHVVLLARNYEGVKEINNLISISNRKDGHFYYTPRITFDELTTISENIYMTTACLGNILNHGSEELKSKLIDFMKESRDTRFLEIQHHNVEDQIEYNKYLYELSKRHDLKLVTGTDAHSIDESHAEGRIVLQLSKGANFPNEDGWDLIYKGYDGLVEAYKNQGSLPISVIKEAIANTKLIEVGIEDFELDISHKYPELYDNPKERLQQRVAEELVKKGKDIDEVGDRVRKEMNDIFSMDYSPANYILLEDDLKRYCRQNGIVYNYGRGSVGGSYICYLLDIHMVDSVKHNLIFERFLNKERISLADIDTDYAPSQISLVKDYVYNLSEVYDKPIYTSEICAFGTIATRGAIRDVGRAFERDEEYSETKSFEREDGVTLSVVEDILSRLNIETGASSLWDDEGNLLDKNNQEVIDEYPNLFRYVKLLEGTIMNARPHPAGTVVSPVCLEKHIGIASVGNSELPVAQIDKSEIEYLNYVKLDILGLKNMEIIRSACELAGIDIPMPDELDENDDKVWKNMLSKGTTGIFQWDTQSSSPYFEKLFNKNTIGFAEKELGLSKFDLMVIGNSAIRPVGASYRNDIAKGDVESHGNKHIDEFLKNRFGRLIFQEDLMMFFERFCGFTYGKADIIRRAFSKGQETEVFLPEIEKGFIQTMYDKYGVEEEEAKEIMSHFNQTIIDSSGYLFNVSHSVEYSYTGYVLGWLRTYYPLEFLASSLETYSGDDEETSKFINYMDEHTDFKMISPKFGYSNSNYTIDKNKGLIFKGLESIKYINKTVSNELFELSQNKKYEHFIDLLVDIMEETSVNKRHIETLIALDFFSEFGSPTRLQAIYNEFRNGEFMYKKSYVDRTKEKRIEGLKDIVDNDRLDYEEHTFMDLITNQMEFMGYTDVVTNNANKNLAVITGMNFNGWTKFYTKLYIPYSGQEIEVEIYQNKVMNMPKVIKEGDFILIDKLSKNNRNGNIVLNEYKIIE